MLPLFIATFFMSTILPIIVLVFICYKFKVNAKYAFFGALGFVIPQLFIRLPLLSSANVVFMLSALPSVLQVFTLAFTAALFETTGRFLVFKLFFKAENRLSSSLAAGVSHGGIEAIVLVGLTYVNNIILYIAASNAQLALALNIPQEILAKFSSMINSTNSFLFILAGFERLGTIAFHAFISVLLFKFMRSNKALKGFIICIALHTALDFFLPLLFQSTNSITAAFIMLILGVVCVFGILKLFKRDTGLSNEVQI